MLSSMIFMGCCYSKDFHEFRKIVAEPQEILFIGDKENTFLCHFANNTKVKVNLYIYIERSFGYSLEKTSLLHWRNIRLYFVQNISNIVQAGKFPLPHTEEVNCN